MLNFEKWFEENEWNFQLKDVLQEAYEQGAKDGYSQAHEVGYNAGYVAGVKKEQEWQKNE